jgi:pimeloyl-ACP methyl ester carboxylesterase
MYLPPLIEHEEINAMKFYEFGKENEETLLLLHGNASTWEMSFGKSIPVLAKQYHVIAAGLDGFDPTEETEYISGKDEAEKIIKYIQGNHGGEIFAIYGSSLGCIPAIYTCISRTITVKNVILDGAEYINFGIFTGVVAKIEKWIVNKVIKGEARILLKMMGLQNYTPEELSKMIYAGATETTLRNAVYTCTAFFRDSKGIEPQNDIRAACWYGSKETRMKKSIKLLGRIFPGMEVKAFEGYGHGDILQHPEHLGDEITRFVDG